jgi:hypothetical protein
MKMAISSRSRQTARQSLIVCTVDIAKLGKFFVKSNGRFGFRGFMKSLVAILITLTGVSAFAQFDRPEVVLRCREERPTYQQLDVVITTGGLSGRHQMRISRGARRPDVRIYLVNVVSSRRAGAPTIYRNGAVGVTLTINYSTAPNRRGERGAILNTRENGREVVLCRR